MLTTHKSERFLWNFIAKNNAYTGVNMKSFTVKNS